MPQADKDTNPQPPVDVGESFAQTKLNAKDFADLGPNQTVFENQADLQPGQSYIYDPNVNGGKPLPIPPEIEKITDPDKYFAAYNQWLRNVKFGTQPATEGRKTWASRVGNRAREVYGVPISDETLEQEGLEAAETPEQVDSLLKEWAAGLYPQFADKIKAGIPPRVLLDPYVQLARRELGRDVKMSDDIIQEAAIGSQMTTLADFRSYIRQQEEWDEGPVALKLSAQLVKNINEGTV